jgi:ATP-dependent Lon protease
MKALDRKLNDHFGGKVVRKDLTKLVKGNAVVPTYVLEYLLGQYCATDDEATIQEGVETVKNIIAKHFVHRDEAELIKSTVREVGSHRIIDKVAVILNDKKNRYEASFANLGLNRIPIRDSFVKEHQKLLSDGVWCILTLGFFATNDKDASPWIIENLKPIQISNIDLQEYKNGRNQYSKDEWIDILMQTIGLNPDEFTFRTKLIQLTRLIPFVENNYNLIELGPKGTGKSHIFSEMSPHGILISGAEVSKAKLFVNMSTGNIGLVGYWDVVAYDEFAGKNKKADKGLVDILKNYMSNKTFSRGTQMLGATASMAYVGNTEHTVSYMIKHSNLFEALPKDYYDAAFLDRMHAFIPGWEVQKLRNEMFTSDYGFIVDYLAAVLRELRKEDRTQEYTQFFELSDSITTRDKTSIAKTFAGLAKIIYPNGLMIPEDAKELMDFAIECRQRVQLQLPKMDETYDQVDFSYKSTIYGWKNTIETLEESEYGERKITTPLEVTDIQTENQEERKRPTIQLPEGQKHIRDNQKGLSYDLLFGAYLLNANEITLIDPYIRQPFQLRNLMEFGILLSQKKDPNIEINLHLVTNNEQEYLENARDAFELITLSMESLGINFSFEFEANIHDRSIDMDNGWKIVLGRGLDIFQRTGGLYEIDNYMQEKRLCKACEITFVRK